MKSISERRYDIDWIRVIAIGLLLLYHTSIAFQPWGFFIGFITNNPALTSLWKPMTMLNVWRIPLLFFVSGMGFYMSMKNRNWKELLAERFVRIGIPLLFSILCIVPIHVMLMQKYYQQKINYNPGIGHLWFLANILIYVLLAIPLIYFFRVTERTKIGTFMKKWLGTPFLFIILLIVMAIEAVLIKPVLFELYAFTWHGFFLGLLAFIFGYLMMNSGQVFWKSIQRWYWLFLIAAALLFFIRLNQSLNPYPVYLISVESNCWILAIFGLAVNYLNKPGNILSYLKDAAYPVYIIHMFILYAGSFWIFPMQIDATIKFILLLFFTFFVSLLIYELLIRRIRFMRFLFGLKRK